MKVGCDDDGARDGCGLCALLAGHGDEPRQPLDCIVVGVLVAVAVREQQLGELEQARELLAVRVERGLTEGRVVEAAHACAR